MLNKVTICILLCLLTTAGFAENFKSLSDIEATLDPLDVLANYGGVRRSIDLDIRFALASAELLPAATHQLDALGQAMNGSRLKKYNFDIIGHTDASGDADVNMQLSKNRANSVASYLQEQFGVDGNRLRTTGKGETALIPKIGPLEAAQRRVEIVVRPGGKSAAAAPTDENEAGEDGEVKVRW